MFSRCVEVAVAYISQNLPPQLLTSLKPLQRDPVLRYAFLLTVDALQGVHEISSGHGRLGDGDLHLVLFGLEVEGLVFLALVLLLPVLVFADIAEGLDRTCYLVSGEGGGPGVGG